MNKDSAAQIKLAFFVLIEIIVCAAIPAVLFFVLGVFSFYFLAVPLIYIAARRTYTAGLISCIIAFFLFYFIFGFNSAAMIFLIILPAVAVVPYLLRSQRRMFESVVLSAGAVAAGIGLFIGFVYIVFKMNIIDYFITMLKDTIDMISAEQSAALLEAYGMNLKEILSELLAELDPFLRTNLPALMINLALVAGLLYFLVPRALLKKRGVNVVNIPPFSKFMLPKSFTWGALSSLVIVLVGYLFNLENFDIVLHTLLAVYLMILQIQGLAVVDFLLRRTGMKTAPRVVILVSGMIVFSLFGLNNILSFAGLFDQIFRFRERSVPKDQDKGGRFF